MNLPAQPVTLATRQIAELNQKLADLRHDVNNRVAKVLAAAEILRSKPEVLERLLPTLLEQPDQISRSLREFSVEFEAALGITRD